MATIAHKRFSSEIPKLEPQLLPETGAQRAVNCVFDSGSLQATREGLLLRTMLSNPIKGVYTEDGLLFYTWPVETQAFKSPVIDDAYRRMYYLQPSVGTLMAASTSDMGVNGPQPAQSFRVGVPAALAAPTLLLVDRSSLPDYPTVSISGSIWWENAGTRYNESAQTPSVLAALRRFQFSVPARPAAPNDSAVLRASLRIVDTSTGRDITSVQMTVGQKTANAAFPGGFEALLGTGGDVTLVWGVVSTRAYTYTYENTWGEEGQNAVPATISPTYIQDVRITVPAAVSFAGYRPLSRINIYRTFPGSTAYIRIKPLLSNGFYFDSQSSPDPAGTTLESANWLPPVLGLQGMVLLPSGAFAAFKDNMLYMTEQYRPHAFAYSETFPKAIRGICYSQGGLVVSCADSSVHLLAGASPASMTQYPLAFPQAAIAQRSMVQLDGAVAFASRDGLPMVVGNQGTLAASQRLFTRESWNQRMLPMLLDASLRLAYHDNMVVGTSHTQANGFVIRLDEDEPGSFTRLEERMDCTFQLPIADALYYSIGNALYQFRGADTYQQFDWHGRDWVFRSDVNFGAGFIRCTGEVTMILYAEGVEVVNKVVTSGHFRVPSRNPRTRWSVRLKGKGRVDEFYLARDMRELKNV